MEKSVLEQSATLNHVEIGSAYEVDHMVNKHGTKLDVQDMKRMGKTQIFKVKCSTVRL